MYGGDLFEVELVMLVFAFLGLWVMLTTLKRGHFLDIEHSAGTTRLLLHGHPDPAALASFRAAVAQWAGVKVAEG